MRYIVGVFFAILIIAGLATTPYYKYGTVDKFTAHVTDKERVVKDGDGKYLIFTKEAVLENTDSWFWWKFNSSDIYGQIEVGKTYKFKTYGWRLRPLSWYKNIISFEEVK